MYAWPLPILVSGAKSVKDFSINRRLSSTGWALVVIVVSLVIAVVTGSKIK